MACQPSIVRTWLDVIPSEAFVVSRAKINAPLQTPRVYTNTCLCVACASCYCSWTIKSSDMNTIIMNQDVHTPAFIKADASNKTNNVKQQSNSPKQVRRFGWTRFIELAILLSVVISAIWLISKVVTPQVVTVVSVIAGFLILCFIVRIVLKITFTLMSILFWLAILCAILLCVLWEAQLCKNFHVISLGGYLAYWDSHLFYFPLRALHFCFFSNAPRYAMTRRRMLFPFYPQR